MAYQLPGQRSETVRRSNLSSILGELHRGALSRSELSRDWADPQRDPRAHRRTGRRGPGRGEPRPARALRAGRRRSCAPAPRRLVLALEIAVDSLAVARSAWAAGPDVARVDRPRGRSSVDETVADLAGLARVVQRPAARQRADRRRRGVVGIVRRDAGFVSMAPNLGWRDVPLGDRLADALGTSLPIAVANEADLGALAELRRGAASTPARALHLRRGRRRRRLDRRRQAVHRAPRVRRRGRPHAVNPNGRACRCGSVGCWETEVGEGALLRRAGHPRRRSREVEPCCARPPRARPRARALDQIGRWLGFGLAGLSTSSTRG